MIPELSPPPHPPALDDFVATLRASGEARVGTYTPDPVRPGPRWPEELAAADAARRDELGPRAPALETSAARWAAEILYRACQFLVCRDVAGEVVRQTLAVPCPGPRTPSVDYSVDLFFSVLPDLYELACQLAPADALVDGLKVLARDWPLSSVGVPLESGAPAAAFLSEPVLLRLYTDRVTARHAHDRLAEPRVRARLRADAGVFPELLPFAATAYEQP